MVDVWGFDEDAVKALKTMEPPDNDKQLVSKYAILLSQDSELLHQTHVKVGQTTLMFSLPITLKNPSVEVSQINPFFAIGLRDRGFDFSHQEEESVTNRVAGFICKYTLSEHTSCVTSMAVVGRSHGYNGTYLVSGHISNLVFTHEWLQWKTIWAFCCV